MLHESREFPVTIFAEATVRIGFLSEYKSNIIHVIDEIWQYAEKLIESGIMKSGNDRNMLTYLTSLKRYNVSQRKYHN